MAQESPREVEHSIALCCRTGSATQKDWQDLYEVLFPFVRGIVRRLAGHRIHELEDMIQEVFTRIFEILPEWNPERASLRTFLRPVAVNFLIDYLRHGQYAAARTVRIDDELQSFRVRARQEPELLQRTAIDFVDRLNDPLKIGIVRAILRGSEVRSICAAFGVKPHEVYTARIWVKKRLNEWSSFLPSS